MTAERFRRALLRLFGPARGWQSRAATALGVDQATVSRYLSGTVPVSGPVSRLVEAWLKNKVRK